MAEPIEIIIRKGSGGTGTGFGVAGADAKSAERINPIGSETMPEDENVKRAEQAAIAFSLATLKRQINYEISQMGNRTGNYIAQAETELAMEMLGNVTTVAMATAAGAKYGGVPGAVAGFLISAGSIGIGYANQYRTLMNNIARLDTYANIMQDRSGNANNNGSRGTDY